MDAALMLTAKPHNAFKMLSGAPMGSNFIRWSLFIEVEIVY
jgi:hypothetical protein